MRTKSMHFRTILNTVTRRSSCLLRLERTLACSSSSLRTQQSVLPQTFLRDSDDNDLLVRRLCGDGKFKDAIDVLCLQNRLKEAIEVLGCVDHPSAATYSTLLQLCLQQRAIREGKIVHDHVKLSGFTPGIFISNRLLDLFCKCESVVAARNVFDKMPQKDVCSWNTMISGYAKVGMLEDARKLFDEMPERDNFSWTAMVSGYVRHDRPNDALALYRVMQRYEKLNCNKFTVSSALSASASIKSLNFGKEIHAHIIRAGLDSDAFVWSALSDMYGKCGSIDEARRIFDKTIDKDIVSWTSMIDRYFEDGRREEGFLLFSKLLKSGIRPNDFTFAGVLNACSHQTAEQLGKQVHGYMIRFGFSPFSFAASALVHMYTKCGNIEVANKVFKWLPQPDLVSWTSLINGYAQSGQPKEALRLFELLSSNIQPDHITFVGVLSACTHAGLVDKGLEYFYSIKEKHGLSHTLDHYACVIDLLSRSGRFRQAEAIINEMPMKPDKFLWASLLGGCRIHKNVDLAERAAGELFKLEPKNAATYVTLANIYATAGEWDKVAKTREKMDRMGVVKKPGLSWIEIKRKVYVFLVGDASNNPKSSETYEFLGKLLRRMKEEGYVPDTDNVLHDVEEEQKEQNLSYHSEKLAVAFGIISTPPGTQIKVFKNLRTCVDCHTAIKFISKIVERRIIVRDSSRFHCFERGCCSCNDYW